MVLIMRLKCYSLLWVFIPASIYLFKVNNGNTIKMWKICSKLTINTPEQCHCSRSGIFSVSFEQISRMVFRVNICILTLQSLMSTKRSHINKPFGLCKYVWPFSGHQALKGYVSGLRILLKRTRLYARHLIQPLYFRRMVLSIKNSFSLIYYQFCVLVIFTVMYLAMVGGHV